MDVPRRDKYFIYLPRTKPTSDIAIKQNNVVFTFLPSVTCCICAPVDSLITVDLFGAISFLIFISNYRSQPDYAFIDWILLRSRGTAPYATRSSRKVVKQIETQGSVVDLSPRHQGPAWSDNGNRTVTVGHATKATQYAIKLEVT